ncbi:MAG TPA: serine/threonine protein kinase, partial [Polyangiaceae bacterium]|nr:serine/threonine protein kinase [Polyangiaceae bacterium]
MGTVYLARHAGEAGFQRLFAVKVMHAHLAEEADFVDMLRDEARLAARIHHPNVVAIVDLG